MQYLGEYRIDDYISFGAQLHRFSSGAVYAPTGNVTYTFYEDNSTTGAPTGGNLAQLNSKTGLYTARVQLTAANGFEAGKGYLIHIEATVDGVAAAELLMFRIVGNPKVDVDTVKTQAITCAAAVTVLANVGFAGAPGANNGAPTTNGTKINQTADLTAGQEIAANVTKVNGAAQTATLDTIKGDTAAILADTNELQTDLANGGRLDLLIDAIKAKTDKLTYTSGNDLDVNVQKVNDTALTGNGSSGNPWGPA